MNKTNALVGQAGGPTSVINASLQGVIRAAAAADDIGVLYGMKFGMDGFLAGNMWNLSEQSNETVNGLSSTPSSALGSSRFKLKDEHLPAVRECLEKNGIGYLFLIGGNDTMDTLHRVEAFCRKEGYALKGIGIPKTVDNDLHGTDHTPGFPSAARYNALSVQQSGRLARDMQKVDSYAVYQTIGRDAGWLAASTSLARKQEGDAPHLIYCPERPFIVEQFVADAKSCICDHGYAVIVVSEGILYPAGSPVSAAANSDNFGNTEYGAMSGASVAMQVHRILAEATGLRGEFQITESLPMCAIDRAEPADIERARACGAEAVRLALSGQSGFMVTLVRDAERADRFTFGVAPLVEVAIRARSMPSEMINERGNHVTEAFKDYIRPLLSPLPEYVSLTGAE